MVVMFSSHLTDFDFALFGDGLNPKPCSTMAETIFAQLKQINIVGTIKNA
jgi:hypothetical protein